MIFLDRVGGGGRAKSSFVTTGPACAADRFLVGDTGCGAGDIGRYEESDPLAEEVLELLLARSASWKAVGGRLNAGAPCAPSFPLMSLEEPGVGGGFGRGMFSPVLLRGRRAWNKC